MPSVLFISLKFFLSRLAMFGITAATSCFTAGPSRSLGDIFTPREIDDYFRYVKYVEKLCLKAISNYQTNNDFIFLYWLSYLLMWFVWFNLSINITSYIRWLWYKCVWIWQNTYFCGHKNSTLLEDMIWR